MCNHHQFSHRVLLGHLFTLLIFFASSSCSVRDSATCHVGRFMWLSMLDFLGERGPERHHQKEGVQHKRIASHSSKQVPILFLDRVALWSQPNTHTFVSSTGILEKYKKMSTCRAETHQLELFICSCSNNVVKTISAPCVSCVCHTDVDHASR